MPCLDMTADDGIEYMTVLLHSSDLLVTTQWRRMFHASVIHVIKHESEFTQTLSLNCNSVMFNLYLMIMSLTTNTRQVFPSELITQLR